MHPRIALLDRQASLRSLMVSAWIYDSDSSADPREQHQKTPNVSVSLSDLETVGIKFWRFKIDEQLEENVAVLMKVN